MKLITGGKYNGKLTYVKEELGVPLSDIYDMASEDLEATVKNMNCHTVLYHLEAFIRKAIEGGLDHDRLIDSYISAHTDCIIICDEVGSGVIPADRSGDLWREEVGRTMCRLAALSGGLIRVTFGVAEEIKK